MIPALVLIAVASVSLVFVVQVLLAPDPADVDYGPNWTKRSRLYWRENGRYCQVCHWHYGCWTGRKRKLQVHHRYGVGGRSLPGDEDDDELLGVCASGKKGCKSSCHQRIHNKERRLARMGLSRNLSRLPAVTRRALWLGCWRRVLRRKP